MSGVNTTTKAASEILVETLAQTATLARHLAELLSQMARLAQALKTHQARDRGSFQRTAG